jgi:predicted ABC-type sugar transport system permease subunit
MANEEKTLTKSEIQKKISSYGFVIVLVAIVVVMSLIAPSFFNNKKYYELTPTNFYCGNRCLWCDLCYFIRRN